MLGKIQKGIDKMTEQIKIDEKYIPEIIDILNRHEDLHKGFFILWRLNTL
jgi:hypothetical protein